MNYYNLKKLNSFKNENIVQLITIYNLSGLQISITMKKHDLGTVNLDKYVQYINLFVGS